MNINLMISVSENLNAELLVSPDAMVACDDDATVMGLIVELGFGGSLPATKDRKGWTQFMGIVGHPTHWIMIARHVGYPLAKDNGYNMVAFPKLHVSEEDATKTFGRMMRSQFLSGNVPPPVWVDAAKATKEN